MVNWKKFFVETDDESTKTNNTENSKDTRSKLQRWFEEDFNENNQENNVDNEFDIEYFDEEVNFEEKKKFQRNKIEPKQEEKNENSNLDFYEDDFEGEYEEEKTNKKRGIFSKFSSLFKEKNKDSNDYSGEDLEADDEPEDYKTYLERQKAEKNSNRKKVGENNNDDDFDFDIEFQEEEHDIFEDDFEDDNNKPSFFAKLKNKFIKEENSFEDDGDFEDELFTEKEFEEKLESEKDEKKGFFSKLFKDSEDKQFEEIDKEEYPAQNKSFEDSTEEQLKYYEELEENTFEEEQEEQLNDTLQNTLKTFGIEADEIKEVDIFSENKERRTHPTLAAVRVKRIIQDQKIDDLGKEVILEDDKNNLVENISEEEIISSNNKESKEEVRLSKHCEERKQLNEDFNNIERKEDILADTKKDSDSELSIDKAIDEIKTQELASLKNNKNYDIKISENEKSNERREKMKYTTVDEILEGNDELFENDVDNAAKKIVVDRNLNKEEIAEDIEKFRKDALNEKTSSDLIFDKNNITELDNLIVDTKLVEKAQEEELEEITKLEENLEIIKKENSEKNIIVDKEEEISIEKIAKDSEIQYPEYNELKEQEISKNILDGYSDYNLDIEEIEELTVKNEIESKSEKADIESLTKEISNPKKVFNNDIDKFKEEKTYTPSKNENSKLEFQENEVMVEKFEEAKPEGIEYTEKLYTNDVTEFFVDDNAPLTFGEYKTKDRGYRPVSKETIESNQKKLDAIFEKYSNISVPRKNTTSYVEQKLTTDTPRSVGKFKPTPVYSSIYGSIDNSKKQLTKTEQPKIEQPLNNKNSKDKSFKKNEKKNYFQEIAKQDETVWSIDLGSRAKKKK